MIKTGGRIIIGAVVVGAMIGVIKLADSRGYLNFKPTVASSVPETGGLLTTNTPATPIPTAQSQVVIQAASGGSAKILVLPWNAEMGLMFANGDVTSSPNSLMAKRGVKLNIERQDDYSQMITSQVAFAKQVAAGVPQPADGAAFVVIMGDGYPAYVAGAQEALGKLGQQIEVIGSLGYSRGEDKCMLPSAVKANPQQARGSLIGAVLRDGDWNICVKWASDNGIPINSDEKTYDPNAMNFIGVNAFTDADEKLIAGYCEDRTVKGSTERRKVCQNGTATWTPGDVKVFTECNNGRACSGIVAVASTKEYMWQMPAIVIGNKQWDTQNKPFVENFLAAALEGGERVRSNDADLTLGSEVSAKVYKEESAAYWKQYFTGVTKQDGLGNTVALGGSTTSGIADNAHLFGLNGNSNLYKSVYTVYGNLNTKYYPDIMPKLVPYESVVNTAYVSELLSSTKMLAPAATPTYSATAATTGTFASRPYSIEFDTGKASFTPRASAILDDLLNQIAVTGLTVQINGHTDNVGNSASNLELSKRRAEAVKTWLVTNAPSNFPADRIRTRGYGDTSPVADNTSSEGRAKNRRVEVKLQYTN